MVLFVLSVLIQNVFMCRMRQQVVGAGSGHLWANLHKTNMVADETCIPYSQGCFAQCGGIALVLRYN